MEREYEVKLWVRYDEGGFEMQKFTAKAESRDKAIGKARIMAFDTYGKHCVSDVALHYCKPIEE